MTKVLKINKIFKLISLSLIVLLTSLNFNLKVMAQQGIPNNAPGITNNQVNSYANPYINNNSANNLQSVQSFRQSAFNYLTNNPNLTNNLMNNSIPVNTVNNNLNNTLPNPTGLQQYNIAMQPHFDQSSLAMPNANAPETQVLSAGVQTQVIKTSTRRSGFSNILSAVAGFGFGPMLYSTSIRPNYGNPLGLAFQGLGYTGFGTRNGFRY